MRKIDWSKVTDNKEIIELIAKRDAIEEQILKIDKMVLVRYELELLAIPQDK
jgi:hypothetical protein